MSLRTRRLSYDIGSNRHIQSAASLIVNLSTAQKFLWKNYAAAPYLLIRSPFAYVMGEEMNWIFWAFIVAAVIHVVKEYKYPGGFSDAMKRFNNLDNLDKIHRQAKRNMVYCPKPYSHQSLVLFVPNRTLLIQGDVFNVGGRNFGTASLHQHS